MWLISFLQVLVVLLWKVKSEQNKKKEEYWPSKSDLICYLGCSVKILSSEELLYSATVKEVNILYMWL